MPIMDIAAQAAANQISAKQQYERSKKLMNIQHGNQRNLNLQGKQLALDMWNETNYGAQMRHIKEAGLNPALMYGMGGGGGTTSSAGSGGSASQGNAHMASMDILNSKLMSEQAELIKAQKDKTKAETENISTVDRELTGIKIEEVTQGIENLKAEYMLTEAVTKLNNINSEIAESGKDYSVGKLYYEMDKIAHESRSALQQANLDEETYSKKIELINNEIIGLTLENEFKRHNIKKTKQEIHAISQGIQQKWEELKLKSKEVNIKEFSEIIRANYPSVFNVVGGNLERFLGGLLDVTKAARKYYHKPDK